MRIFFPLIFATAIILVFGSFELLLLRFLNRTWWQSKYIRIAAWGLPLFGVAMVLAWGLGEYYTLSWLALPASVLAALTFIFEVGLMLSLPISGLFHFMHWSVDRYVRHKMTSTSEHLDPNRRIVLKAAAAALPVVTLTMGGSGLTKAFGKVRVYLKPIRFDDLAPELEGLRILHLSDMHLRHYVTLDDLEEVISQAMQFAPDLVLVTGDLADDLRLLPDTLALIFSLRPSLGAFATLGNHEYYRGVTAVRRIFDRSPIPLLVNNGVHIPMGSCDLFVGGIDDPRFLGVQDTTFFERAIEQTLAHANTKDFIVLMSHRPDGFDYAAEAAIDLMLAGHTHGGQIGIMNRSLFEAVWPKRYFWGHYQMNKSHLYTSSGVGHWFPFRLGCPPEAPVIELCRQ